MPNTFVIDKLRCEKQENVLFSNLSFQLNDGDILLIEGANGSGKSSLLRLLAGLATPASGDILWLGKSIAHSAAEYAQHLHYVGHANGLRLDLTVKENLACIDHALLTHLQLKHLLPLSTRSLSAGQKRKLALANLIIAKKKLWLLDEPLTALDAETQTFFFAVLQKHLQQGGMAVISSHQTFSLPNVTIQSLRLS